MTVPEAKTFIGELERTGLPRDIGGRLISADDVMKHVFEVLERLATGRILEYTFDDVFSTCTEIPMLMVKFGWLLPCSFEWFVRREPKEFVLTREGRAAYDSLRIPDGWL
jgi:hypothetical protein